MKQLLDIVKQRYIPRLKTYHQEHSDEGTDVFYLSFEKKILGYYEENGELPNPWEKPFALAVIPGRY